MYKLLRLSGTVIIDHRHTDILHLHAHHPGHDTHDDNGKQDDKAWQKTVTPYLEELLLYEISECHSLFQSGIKLLEGNSQEQDCHDCEHCDFKGHFTDAHTHNHQFAHSLNIVAWWYNGRDPL